MLVPIFSLIFSIQSQGCSDTKIRKDIKQLSLDEWNRYVTAVKKLDSEGIYEKYVEIHYNYASGSHGTAQFFPWHRKFLSLMEAELQRIDSSVTMPYWDWSRDYLKPEASQVLSSSFYGGDGYGSCVEDGSFRGRNTTFPMQHCLVRQFNSGNNTSFNGLGPFYSDKQLELILSNAKNFNEIWNGIESVPHATFHNSIGGDMIFLYSPNDPLFFSHHAFIDLLWEEWQQRNPTLASTYDGDSTTNMNPFDVSVDSVFTLSTLCYNYDSRWTGGSLSFTNPTKDYDQNRNSTDLRRRQAIVSNEVKYSTSSSVTTKNGVTSASSTTSFSQIMKTVVQGRAVNLISILPSTATNTLKIGGSASLLDMHADLTTCSPNLPAHLDDAYITRMNLDSKTVRSLETQFAMIRCYQNKQG